jgi:DNA-binding transcriptional LysR family regulator
MESGDIDLAIGHFEGFGGNIFSEQLFNEQYVCVVRRKHPSIKKNLTMKQFLACPHLVYRPTAGSHAFFEDSVEQLFNKLGKARSVAVRVSHGLGLGQIIKQTDLLASLPSRLATELAQAEGLRVMRLPIDSPQFEICQYWHRRAQHDGANLWLRSTVSKLFSQKLIR